MNEATADSQRPTATELAEQRTGLAASRTGMANERTLMAWVRTSLSMISFGFTIYKFLQDLSKLETSHVPDHGPKNLGLTLVGLGTAALIVASFQYWNGMRQLRGRSSIRRKFPLTLIIAIAISLLGILVFFGMAAKWGPY